MAVEIGALRAMLSLDSAAFERGARRAEAAMSNMRRRFAVVGRQMRRIGTTMSAAVTGPMVAATGALVGSAVTAATEIDRLARVSNAGTTEFQRFAAAAKAASIEQDQVADILKDVNDRVGDFLQTGGGPMADFFENIAPKVGVTAEQFAKLSGPQALQLYVSSLEKAGASQQEMTFYMEAMASDATLLLPLMRDNGREMERLGQRASDLGAIMDGETIASLVRTRRAFGTLATSGTALRNELGAALAPTLERLAELVAQAAQWFSELSPEMKTMAARAAAAAAALGPLLVVLGTIVAVVAAAGAPFAILAGLLTAGAAAFVIFGRDAKTASGATKAAQEAQDALNAAMGVFYQTGAPSAAQAARDAANANYELTQSALAAAEAELAKRRALLDSSTGRMKRGAQTEVNAAEAELQAAEDALRNAKAQRDQVARVVTDAPRNLGTINLPGEDVDEFTVKVEGLNDTITDLPTSFGGAASSIDTDLADLGDQTETAADRMKSAFDGVADSIGNAMAGAIVQGRSMADSLRGVFQQIAQDLISSGISRMISGLFAGGNGGGGGLGSIFAGLFDAGGMIPGGQVGIVGERGPELVRGPAVVTGRQDTARMMGQAQRLAVTVTMDPSTGALGAFVRGQSGRVVAQAAPGIVQEAVKQTGRQMSRSGSFGAPNA